MNTEWQQSSKPQRAAAVSQFPKQLGVTADIGTIEGWCT